jgi:hypothetical protein
MQAAVLDELPTPNMDSSTHTKSFEIACYYYTSDLALVIDSFL